MAQSPLPGGTLSGGFGRWQAGRRHGRLQKGAAGPVVTFKDGTEGSIATDASPMRADFIAAVTEGIETINPGVPVSRASRWARAT
ncbi:hypothetical protein GCM10009087_05840 [Sphingomonas oligophenolica]